MAPWQLAASSLAFPVHQYLDLLATSMLNEAAPSLAPQWTANMDVTQEVSGSFPFTIANASFVYDEESLRWLERIESTIPVLGPNATRTQLVYTVNTSIYMDINEQCSTGEWQSKFDDMFGWIKYSSFSGQMEVHGQVCDLYNLTVPGKADLRMCLDGDLPVEMNTTVPGQFTSLRFYDAVRKVDPAALTPPDRCFSPPEACGDGHVAKQTIYLFHPETNYNISGQDVADLLGDATFLCSDKSMWVQGGYSLLSAFELSWVEKFSAYSNCPPNASSPTGASCFGGDGFHVGRGSAMSLGHRQGQCDGDAPEFFEQTGIWYSMPVGGECGPNQEPGDGSCTWKVLRRTKTIDMKCLFTQHALEKACENTTAPFESVAVALLKALTSENSASGGCPPVEPQSEMILL